MSFVPYVTCKETVDLTPWSPIASVIHAALVSASSTTGLPITITCGTEGHGPMDPHTRGEARDLRTREWSAQQILEMIGALNLAFHQLTPGLAWTVLYETPRAPADARLAAVAYVNPQASADHLHVQLHKGATYPAPAQG